MKKKVVFDVDDILWELCRKTCRLAGIDFDTFVLFRVKDNHLWTDEQKQKVIDIFNQNETFENIEWSDGIERINDLNKICDVHINSNALTDDIIRLKREQLKQVIHIPDERVVMNIVNLEHKGETKKVIDNDTYIFVDDSPHNVAMSPAKYNIMIRRPYNQSENGMSLLKGKNVIFCDDLNQVIDTIYDLL